MRFASLFVLCLLLVCPCVSAEVHDVLVHASPDLSWIAKVSTQGSGSTSFEQTDLLIRQSGPGERWKTLTTIPARVTALACRGSQLAILQSNGDWKLIWSSEGGSSGPPLPGGARIRALSDDGENLWAVGALKGGLSAATEPATTEPMPEVTAATTQPMLPLKLVLFEQRAGKWTGVAEFPPEPDTLVSVTGEISLAIVAGRPMVAFELSDHSIRTLRYAAEQGWENLGLISPGAGEKFADFELISAGDSPILWTSGPKGPGQLYRGADGKSPPVDLKWIGNNAPESLPAIAAAGGYVRLVGLHGDSIYEQRYEPDGTPVGSAAELVVPTNLNDSPLIKGWLNGALMLALAFSVIATLYRRTLLRKRMTELTPPPPAPLILRAVAGFLDMLPFLITFTIVTAHQDKSRDPLERLEDLPAIIAVGISIAVYLLHTTLSELFTSRTFGKWLFGLQVVTVEGGKPNVGQLLIRNILRVLDLLWFPLILVVISPLRQRSADIAAGTMVVRREDAQKPIEIKDPPDVGNDPKT